MSRRAPERLIELVSNSDTYTHCTHCEEAAAVLAELVSEDPYCGAFLCLKCLRKAAELLEVVVAASVKKED